MKNLALTMLLLFSSSLFAFSCADAEVNNTEDDDDDGSDSDSDSDSDGDTDSDTDGDTETEPPDCLSPPEDYCADAGVLMTYAETGTWNGTECEYTSSPDYCDEPPADTCVGLTAWTYDEEGACASGACEYGHAEVGSGTECDAGVCLGCDQGANVASSATPTTSGGGVDSVNRGPAELNDGNYESACDFCWITSGTSLTGGAYFQYTWPTAQTLWGMHIDTVSSSSCSGTSVARRLAGANIQWWDGSAWVTDGTVTGQSGDWDWEFTTEVTTTSVRLYNAYAATTINASVFEWEVFACN